MPCNSRRLRSPTVAGLATVVLVQAAPGISAEADEPRSAPKRDLHLSVLGTYHTGAIDPGAAEIVAYDAETYRAYDVTRPLSPRFAGYFSNRDPDGDAEAGTAGDLGPEGLLFVRAGDSPTGMPLLLVGNEVSGTTTIWSVSVSSN